MPEYLPEEDKPMKQKSMGSIVNSALVAASSLSRIAMAAERIASAVEDYLDQPALGVEPVPPPEGIKDDEHYLIPVLPTEKVNWVRADNRIRGAIREHRKGNGKPLDAVTLLLEERERATRNFLARNAPVQERLEAIKAYRAGRLYDL